MLPKLGQEETRISSGELLKEWVSVLTKNIWQMLIIKVVQNLEDFSKEGPLPIVN